MERVTLTFPDGLRARAHAVGLNLSGASARAIERAVQAIEGTETGATACQQVSPATTTSKGRAS